MHGAFFHVT